MIDGKNPTTQEMLVEPGLEKFLKMNQGKNLHDTLGLELTQISRGLMKGRLLVTEKLRQPMGLLHGGVSVAIAEGLGSFGAMILADDENSYPLGLEINANHVSSIEANGTKYITAESTCLHGKSTQIWETQIKREDNDKLLCISRFTCFILPKSKL